MIGQTISHYKILEKIGQGGMGVVYKAEDTKLKRTVALKFLLPQALETEEEKIRFVREAQAAAALDHPNISTIYEVDEAEGKTFIAMAYIEGQTLKKKIKSGPLKLSETLDIAIQVAEGLKEAHQRGTNIQLNLFPICTAYRRDKGGNLTGVCLWLKNIEDEDGLFPLCFG